MSIKLTDVTEAKCLVQTGCLIHDNEDYEDYLHTIKLANWNQSLLLHTGSYLIFDFLFLLLTYLSLSF